MIFIILTYLLTIAQKCPKADANMNRNSHIKESAHFFWFESGDGVNLLGKGATGVVYQGWKKNSCEKVAIKIFITSLDKRPPHIQRREYDLLKDIRHPNIVGFIGSEKFTDDAWIIAMEYCSGGSLYSKLEKPEFMYGLPEDDILQLIRDLTSAIKYLHRHRIIHRDVKPGNIIIAFKNGKQIYKLADFGTALKLEETDQYYSICGTEEYLHPIVYGRAILGVPVTESFRASTDLWSIGVTIYHAITGSLPFKPHGGRRNHHMMYHIIKDKRPGYISGVQNTAGGEVQWSKNLPKYCNVSKGLRLFIEALLAGLMETDAQKQWAYEKYISYVDTLKAMTVLHVFCVSTLEHLRVYADKTDSYARVCKKLAEQTTIRVEHQLLVRGQLFYTGEHLSKSIEHSNTSESEPLLLVDTHKVFHVIDEFKVSFETFGSDSLSHDAKIAKYCCAVLYKTSQKLTSIVLAIKLTVRFIEIARQVLSKEIKEKQMKAHLGHLYATEHCQRRSFAQHTWALLSDWYKKIFPEPETMSPVSFVKDLYQVENRFQDGYDRFALHLDECDRSLYQPDVLQHTDAVKYFLSETVAENIVDLRTQCEDVYKDFYTDKPKQRLERLDHTRHFYQKESLVALQGKATAIGLQVAHNTDTVHKHACEQLQTLLHHWKNISAADVNFITQLTKLKDTNDASYKEETECNRLLNKYQNSVKVNSLENGSIEIDGNYDSKSDTSLSASAATANAGVAAAVVTTSASGSGERNTSSRSPDSGVVGSGAESSRNLTQLFNSLNTNSEDIAFIQKEMQDSTTRIHRLKQMCSEELNFESEIS